MRATLIVNPHATSTTERRRDLLAHALASQTRLTVAYTSGRGHAVELAAVAARAGSRLVVIHGGDGTVNEAVNGIMSMNLGAAAPTLAIVPGGSTNVFARAIGVEAEPLAATEQIIDAISRQRAPLTVSLGMADDRYFTFNAGLGLDAEVVEAVEARRAKGRPISNALHVRKAVRRYLAADRRHPRLRITSQSFAPIGGAHLLFVSNVDPWTYYRQRPVRTNPTTTPEGGLGVFAATSLALPTVVRIVNRVLRAPRNKTSSKVFTADDVAAVEATCSEPVGLQVDGDYLGTRSSVRFRSVPRALRVLGPLARTAWTDPDQRASPPE